MGSSSWSSRRRGASAGRRGIRDRFRIGDGLLAALFLVLIVLSILRTADRIGDTGSQAEIISDGQSLGVYSLDREQELRIEGNGYYNVVRLGGGEVSVTEADCPDQCCVRQRAISRTGESIVCLPSRLVVRVVQGEEAPWDAISK